MALIRVFENRYMERNSLHREIPAYYTVFERDQAVFVQINTSGTDDRQNPGKTSQSIQLDRQGAEALVGILRAAFHF